MKLYCGIDLHGNNNVISIIDEKDLQRSRKMNGVVLMKSDRSRCGEDR
jgi:hypothetical protein